MSKVINLSFDTDNLSITQNQETRQLLNNPLLQKDSWQTVEDLGLKINLHNKVLSISFQSIEPDWLKLVVKLYILIRSQRKISSNYLRNDVYHLTRFSLFIQQKAILTPEEINNQTFEEFEYYLRSLKLSHRTIALYFTALNNFFNLCRQEGWLEVNTYWFKGRCKMPTPKNDEIEYIPEEVWQQLDQNLYHLPEPIQRMVLIIRGTGLRIGELLNLPLDCLRQRNEQWRLRLLTEKYQIEDELPICPELVVVIQEQQEYIGQQFGDKYDKLFGSNDSDNHHYNPIPRVMNLYTFNNWLNRLAKKQNICTSDGKIWYFQSHQFRRTLATIMTNAGVRDLIIQKYLRHRSPDIQNHYKHLLKQVLGNEYRELMKGTNYIDSTGKLVAAHKPKDLVTELLRRKMYQITTQYGECHRPVLKSPCQTVNACWQCEHWLTSVNDLNALKDDFQRVAIELEVATKLGMTRQQQGLANDQQSLIVRIQGLEKLNGRD